MWHWHSQLYNLGWQGRRGLKRIKKKVGSEKVNHMQMKFFYCISLKTEDLLWGLKDDCCFSSIRIVLLSLSLYATAFSHHLYCKLNCLLGSYLSWNGLLEGTVKRHFYTLLLSEVLELVVVWRWDSCCRPARKQQKHHRSSFNPCFLWVTWKPGMKATTAFKLCRWSKQKMFEDWECKAFNSIAFILLLLLL